MTTATTTGPQVGDEAPDFALLDSDRSPVRLSSYRGERDVVVVFFPLAFSGICTPELCGLRDRLAAAGLDDVQVLAISVDLGPALGVFARQEGYAFPLLSDAWPHGATAQAYGCFDEGSGLALRGTFVVDRTGVVRYRVVQGIEEPRDMDEVVAALRALR